MVDIRSVHKSDLDDFLDLHNTYVNRDESIEALRDRYQKHPDLFLGAYDNGELVGHCLGRPRSDRAVELEGIAVERSFQQRGIGTELLARFEDRVADLGFQRISLGSAGGYVDKFYIERGYSPVSVLVRYEDSAVSERYRDRGYEIREERMVEGTRKLYIEADEFDPGHLGAVREEFDDQEAIYIMEKEIDGS